MRLFKFSFRGRFLTMMIGITSVFLVASVLMYPAEILDSSTQGIRIWWNMVFPALLPFFILCDIVMAYGIIHALGVVIDPLMRKVFNLPGVASWSLLTGMLAGSPAGTESIVKLRLAGQIDQQTGERITMLNHYANPIFMVTIVSVAFLHRPDLAVFICAVHYLSVIGCAILLRKCWQPDHSDVDNDAEEQPRSSLSNRVTAALKEAKQQDQRSFGKILGDAVSDSLQKLLMIGGTIIMFSVLIELVSVTGITGIIVNGISYIIPSSSSLIRGTDTFVAGLTEAHLGIFAVTQLEQLSTLWKVAVLCSMLGWGGLAVHLQVRALIHPTDIRYTPFLVARIVQSMLSMLLVFILWKPYLYGFKGVIPSYLHETPITTVETKVFWDMYLPWQNSYVLLGILTFLLAAVIYSSRKETN